MVEILRKLRAEHDDLAKMLDVMEQEVEAYRQTGRLNGDILGDVLDYCRGYAALCHHPKEDLIYRKLRLASDPAAIDPVGDLDAEHEALVAVIDALEAAFDNLLPDPEVGRGRFVGVARSFLERHRHHMRVEEDELFPIAARCLSGEDWAEIDRQVIALEAAHVRPAFGVRLAALSREVVERERIEREGRKNVTTLSGTAGRLRSRKEPRLVRSRVADPEASHRRFPGAA
jgi:hemerythrin-like domain-containing protein